MPRIRLSVAWRERILLIAGAFLVAVIVGALGWAALLWTQMHSSRPAARAAVAVTPRPAPSALAPCETIAQCKTVLEEAKLNSEHWRAVVIAMKPLPENTTVKACAKAADNQVTEVCKFDFSVSNTEFDDLETLRSLHRALPSSRAAWPGTIPSEPKPCPTPSECTASLARANRTAADWHAALKALKPPSEIAAVKACADAPDNNQIANACTFDFSGASTKVYELQTLQVLQKTLRTGDDPPSPGQTVNPPGLGIFAGLIGVAILSAVVLIILLLRRPNAAPPLQSSPAKNTREASRGHGDQGHGEKWLSNPEPNPSVAINLVETGAADSGAIAIDSDEASDMSLPGQTLHRGQVSHLVTARSAQDIEEQLQKLDQLLKGQNTVIRQQAQKIAALEAERDQVERRLKVLEALQGAGPAGSRARHDTENPLDGLAARLTARGFRLNSRLFAERTRALMQEFEQNSLMAPLPIKVREAAAAIRAVADTLPDGLQPSHRSLLAAEFAAMVNEAYDLIWPELDSPMLDREHISVRREGDLGNNVVAVLSPGIRESGVDGNIVSRARVVVR